jgi:hypothetical protein
MISNRALFVGSTAGMALLNFFALKIPTIIVAAILGLAAYYLRKSTFKYFELEVFLVAEISPISLWASLPVALAYQAMCVLLLIAILPLHDKQNSIPHHQKELIQIAALAGTPLVLFAIIVQTNAVVISANQVLSLCVLLLLAAVCVALAAEHYELHLFKEVEL